LYSSTHMEDKTPGIPIAAQFAEILTHDLSGFVHDLEEINSPENNQLVALARQAMEADGVIQNLEDIEGLGSMVAVDGGNNILSMGSGSHCFILAVRYSLRSDYSPHFMMERIQFEDPEPSGFMYGVRNAMEIQQIMDADEKDSFCIVDNSWVSLLETVNRTIDCWIKGESDDKEILESFLEPLLASWLTDKTN